MYFFVMQPHLHRALFSDHVIFQCLCDFLAHLCQSSVVWEVRQIHHSSVREILNFVHIGLSALNTHIHRHRFFKILF